ncbi:MAG: hypothetical protein IJ815_00575 [Lachnospiraceae bacterium]|nr:hypothetical protein [Lachnospiraceae bacterium]
MGYKSFLGTVILTAAFISASIFSDYSASVNAAEQYETQISSFETLQPSEYYFECSDINDIAEIINNFPNSLIAYDSSGTPIHISVRWECSYNDGQQLIYAPRFDNERYLLDDELRLDIPRMQICISSNNEKLHTMSSVTFDDLNANRVFLKQEESGTCTLCAAAMLVRRAAMLDGNEDWSEVTESSMKSVAWLPGAGLYHNFTYAGISISSELTDIDESFLKDFLDEHPEGIVIYNYAKPHAILITDYDGDTFYCSDPSNSIAKGRIDIDNASMGIDGCTRYWYVKSPEHLSYDNGDKAPDKEDSSDDNESEDDESEHDDNDLPKDKKDQTPSDNSTSDNSASDNSASDDSHDKTVSNDQADSSVIRNEPSEPAYAHRREFTINYYSKIPFNGKKLTLCNFGKMTVSYCGKEYNVDKIKVNKNNQTFQILSLAGADKKLNKAIKKATKKSNQINFYNKPYYISNRDRINVVYSKSGDEIKRIFVYFEDNTYKVKKYEYSYDSSTHTIVFDSGNLKGKVGK